jgi:hypothetical protein
MNSDIIPVKKFSALGLFATLACMVVLAISLIAIIIFRDPGQSPGPIITTMLFTGGLGTIFGWLYFATGRALPGWFLATALLTSAIVVTNLAVLEYRAGPSGLGNDAGTFATVAAINAILCLGLITSLLRRPRATSGTARL